MTLNDHYRALGAGWDAIAAATDTNRATALTDQAYRFDSLADSGLGRPDSDRLAALVLNLLADAERVATGQWAKRMFTASPLEDSCGPILNRWTLTRDMTGRAVLLADLALTVPDDDVAEMLACLPLANNRLGWSGEEAMPSARTWRGFVGALGVAWRARRAGR